MSAALRALSAPGVPLVFTDAPKELALVALSELGAARRVDVVETGEGALARLRNRLGEDAALVRTRSELLRHAA